MSSRAISGKPGGGKSYYAVERLILDDLLGSERFIVTNIPLKPTVVMSYCEAHGKSIAFDERVLLIGNDNQRMNDAIVGDEAMRDFWRYRSPELVLPSVSDDEIRAGIRPSMESFGQSGVHYYLDEWHEFCNSRQWAKTGPMLLWYIAKHRHFGDDVTWITQHVPNVDKQWRSVTQEYLYCRNYSKERFWGFAKPSRFTCTTYLEPFTGTQAPQEVTSFKIDPKGIGSCYYTSLANTAADTGEKKRGRPMWMLFAIIAILALVVWWVAAYGVSWASSSVIGGLAPKIDAAPAAVRGGVDSVLPDKYKSTAGAVAPVSSGVRHVVAVPLRYVSAADVVKMLGVDSNSGLVGNSVADPLIVAAGADGSSVIVAGSDFADVVGRVELIKRYDVSAASVTVSMVVGRVQGSNGSGVGLYDLLRSAALNVSGNPLGAVLENVQYDALAGVVSFGSVYSARLALAVLTDFRADSFQFSVDSRPSITSLSGIAGSFTAGREVPIPVANMSAVGSQGGVQFKQAVFSVNVTPSVRPDGSVRLVIDQGNSDVLSSSKIDGNEIPTLSTQSLKTTIDIAPGDVAYLGGIRTQSSRDEKRGVPVLRDIPFVDYIFARRDRVVESSELVILLTVEVFAAGESPTEVRRALPIGDDASDRFNNSIDYYYENRQR